MPGHARARIAFSLVAIAALAAGCGAESAERPVTLGDPSKDAYFSRHPYALTCEHVLAVDSVKAGQFHMAARRLARDVPLQDLCKKRGDLGYRPAADAVRLVSKGRYVVTGAPTAEDVRRWNARARAQPPR